MPVIQPLGNAANAFGSGGDRLTLRRCRTAETPSSQLRRPKLGDVGHGHRPLELTNFQPITRLPFVTTAGFRRIVIYGLEAWKHLLEALILKRQLSVLIFAPLALLCAGACERILGVELKDPSRVSDLAVTQVGLDGATLGWTEVANGAKRPADYLVFVGSPTAPAWTGDPSGGIPVTGQAVGAPSTFSIGDLDRAKTYSAYVVSLRQSADSIYFGQPSVPVGFTTEASDPNAVDDLEAAPQGTNAVQLRWTGVDDGAGLAANYLIAYGQPPVNWTTAQANAIAVPGAAISALTTAVVSGLAEGVTYEFRIASIRGTPGAAGAVTSAFSPAVTATTDVTPPVVVQPFFSDGFDSGLRNNANGFAWQPSTARVTVSTDRPFSGTHSLRHRFGPDTLKGDSSAEQRFNMGRYLSQYWVEYMLYIPANFFHRYDPGTNNKFFSTWRDAYSDVTGGTWRVSYEFETTITGAGNSFLRPMSSRWDFNSMTSSGLDHPQYGAPFIGGSGPLRVGQWNRIRMEFKAASSRAAADGIMRLWVNDALYAEKTNGKFHNFFTTPADATLRNGYFLGWSNSGYEQETIFYIDNVRFFDVNPGW